jgi:hypothetical protein
MKYEWNRTGSAHERTFLTRKSSSLIFIAVVSGWKSELDRTYRDIIEPRAIVSEAHQQFKKIPTSLFVWTDERRLVELDPWLVI